MDLGKFWPNLKILEVFLMGLKSLFWVVLHLRKYRSQSRILKPGSRRLAKSHIYHSIPLSLADGQGPRHVSFTNNKAYYAKNATQPHRQAKIM